MVFVPFFCFCFFFPFFLLFFLYLQNFYYFFSKLFMNIKMDYYAKVHCAVAVLKGRFIACPAEILYYNMTHARTHKLQYIVMRKPIIIAVIFGDINCLSLERKLKKLLYKVFNENNSTQIQSIHTFIYCLVENALNLVILTIGPFTCASYARNRTNELSKGKRIFRTAHARRYGNISSNHL